METGEWKTAILAGTMQWVRLIRLSPFVCHNSASGGLLGRREDDRRMETGEWKTSFPAGNNELKDSGYGLATFASAQGSSQSQIVAAIEQIRRQAEQQRQSASSTTTP